MTINDVCNLINAEIVYGEGETVLNPPKGYASDMMSDVLAFVSDHSLLLTGLVNEQVIRTAAMLEIKGVIIVRGKTPTPGMLSLAEQNAIAVLRTEHSLFESCGILYNNGVHGEV